MTDADLAAIQMSLLRRCALGDAAALRELYDGCAPQLYAVVLRILSKPDLAEDALQDAFLQIWRNAGSYRPGKGQPMTWMYGIARYRALDSVRRAHGDRYVADGDEALATIATADPGPLEQLAATVDGRILQNCMDQLTDDQRNSIQMAYFRGQSHDEIATSLNTPLGTVKSWVRRGLQALKSCVDR